MRGCVKRGATENREASPRHLPGGYGARAREDCQRASHDCAGSRQRQQRFVVKRPGRDATMPLYQKECVTLAYGSLAGSVCWLAG